MDHDTENEAEISTGTWFIQMDTFCGDVVCETEGTKVYFQSVGPLGITTSIKIATGIMSAVGPLFFAVFWFIDNAYYNKHGKAIMIC